MDNLFISVFSEHFKSSINFKKFGVLVWVLLLTLLFLTHFRRWQQQSIYCKSFIWQKFESTFKIWHWISSYSWGMGEDRIIRFQIPVLKICPLILFSGCRSDTERDNFSKERFGRVTRFTPIWDQIMNKQQQIWS